MVVVRVMAVVLRPTVLEMLAIASSRLWGGPVTIRRWRRVIHHRRWGWLVIPYLRWRRRRRHVIHRGTRHMDADRNPYITGVSVTACQNRQKANGSQATVHA